MPNAEHSVTIARPAHEVFAFLANAENDLQWRKGVTDIARVSGEGVGTVYRQGVKGPFGRRIPADVEITTFEPDRSIGFRALAGPVRPQGRYELEEDEGRTTVTFMLGTDLHGMKKLMGPMVAKQMNAEVHGLERLKALLEGGTPLQS
jgi:uncharacterized membrane protein